MFGRNAETAEEEEANEVNGPTVTALEQSERETRHTRKHSGGRASGFANGVVTKNAGARARRG